MHQQQASSTPSVSTNQSSPSQPVNPKDVMQDENEHHYNPNVQTFIQSFAPPLSTEVMQNMLHCFSHQIINSINNPKEDVKRNLTSLQNENINLKEMIEKMIAEKEVERELDIKWKNEFKSEFETLAESITTLNINTKQDEKLKQNFEKEKTKLVEDHKQIVSKLESDKSKLEKELETLKKKKGEETSKEWKQKFEILEKEKEKLQKDAKTKVENLEKEKLDLKQKIENLEKGQLESKNKLEKMENDRNETKKKLYESEKKLNELITEYKKIDKLWKECETDKKKLKSENDEMKILLNQKKLTEIAMEKGIIMNSDGEKKLDEIKKTLVLFENTVFDQTCKVEETDLGDLLEVALYCSICKCFIEKRNLLERKTFAETKFKEFVNGKFDSKETTRLIEFMHSQISILHSTMENSVNLKWDWFEKPDVNNANFECKNEFKIASKNMNKVIYFSAIPSIHYGTQLSRKGTAFKIIYTSNQ